MKTDGIDYTEWVNYGDLDPFKKMAMQLFEPTLKYPERLGVRIVRSSGGLTATAFDIDVTNKHNLTMALNVEGLGTKNKIADELYRKKQIADEARRYGGYTCVGQDLVAMSVNDQIGIGADTVIYGDIISVREGKWLKDEKRNRALLQGMKNAADEGQFAIPLGETPALKGVIVMGTADMAGASVGIIWPKDRFTDGSKIIPGDNIYGLSTPGLNANGISKVRGISNELPDGYLTKIDGDTTLADAVLVPTPIYTRPIIDMFSQGVAIHGLQPITGHAWKKIARVRKNLTYRIKNVPEPPLVFRKLIEIGKDLGNFNVSDNENYYVWNMGVGFVVIAPKESEQVINKCASKYGLTTYNLGVVEKGERKVIMEPFGFDYKPE